MSTVRLLSKSMQRRRAFNPYPFRLIIFCRYPSHHAMSSCHLANNAAAFSSPLQHINKWVRFGLLRANQNIVGGLLTGGQQ
mmetsp:Transcript_13010/g.21391  ORF Transcript_13010/g.21391 Transcript_13010/m.21391 type:complete len:81 (-) Transcript_13010:221-463(-)